MATPHPHAESMRLYAEDAAETDTPWRQWEFRRMHCIDWAPCTAHPAWKKDCGYRRKPRTITVNGIEVPEPERKPLQRGTTYFTPEPNRLNMYDFFEWVESEHDMTRLGRGLIHLSREAAQDHAEAMIAPSKQESK